MGDLDRFERIGAYEDDVHLSLITVELFKLFVSVLAPSWLQYRTFRRREGDPAAWIVDQQEVLDAIGHLHRSWRGGNTLN
jgi:hypothetical protein